MFNKRKVLYSAMAVALMSGGGSVWAATTGLNLSYPNPSVSAYIASESVAVGDPVGENETTQFVVGYIPANAIASDFDIFFTLSGGATWNVGASVPDHLTATDAGGALLDISILGPNYNADKTEVRYRIGAATTKIETTSSLTFSFSIIDKGGVLGSEGGSISLSTRLQLTTGDKSPDAGATTKDLTLITSKDSQKLTLAAETTVAKIDVADNSLSFVVGNSNSDSATLGTIQFANNSTYLPATLSGTFSPTTSLAASTGEFTIVDAPFNASITSPGAVFIDLIANGLYDEDDGTGTTGDLLATKVSGNEATWTLSGDDADRLASECGTAACKIMIKADGSTAIEEASTQPPSILSIQYDNGVTKKANKKLAYIKRNGSVCTLYNIPNATATDELSVRVTNTSNKDGAVTAKMYDLAGNVLIPNKTLIETIKPKQTVRLDVNDLLTLAGGTNWAGRAVLTLSSTIPDGYMEVFGLVRNRLGGPLMNLSAGAQGNGCGK